MTRYTICNNLLETIGGTPLVRIHAMNESNAEIIAKVEFFNPGGSVKDRIGIFMIEDAEKRGLLRPSALIVEPTSGNTGIGLALAAAIKGYRLILTMPDSMSLERRKLLAAYGADLVLTPGNEGMNGAIRKAEEILRSRPGSWMPRQFENPANPAAHEKSTAPEIWRSCNGKIDCFVAGIGTGGTFTGTVRFLKQKNPEMTAVAVEPAGSPVLSGGKPGPHALQGIGAGFIPETLDVSLIDEVFPVQDEDAKNAARSAAAHEGLLIGISGGAALHAALEIGKRPSFAGKRIVVLLPDSGGRYLSGDLFG